MKQIISEYGSAIIAMVCVLMLIALVIAIVFTEGSPMGESIVKFANSICGG